MKVSILALVMAVHQISTVYAANVNELSNVASPDALLVIDMQHCFLDKNGPVPVPTRSGFVDAVRSMVTYANTAGWTTAASKDWHPPNHISFKNQYPAGTKSVIAPNGMQLPLFNPHCIANTTDSQMVPPLKDSLYQKVVTKGKNPKAESFSAFFNIYNQSHGLPEFMKSRNVSSIALAGVATEYCVRATCLDALKLGYKVLLVSDGIAGVTEEGAVSAIKEMQSKGAKLMTWSEITELKPKKK